MLLGYELVLGTSWLGYKLARYELTGTPAIKLKSESYSTVKLYKTAVVVAAISRPILEMTRSTPATANIISSCGATEHVLHHVRTPFNVFV